MLLERFAAAAASEPLSDLAVVDRRELDVLLGAVTDFDDLPGRWQAALLAAESGAQVSSGQCPCCAK